MWEMAKSSIGLFLQGRLFQDPGKVFRQVLLNVVITALLLVAIIVGLALAGLDFGTANVWIAAGIAGFIGGMLQPYLFKDLKYA